MARTFSCNEEIIVVSKGTEDIGKLAMLGNNGKFDPSVIPSLSGGIPAGAIQYFAMDVIPEGWLKANGQAVQRSKYASLFKAIGEKFGGGDGSTTFNLPDLRGEFIRGWDDGRGVDTGRTFGTSQGSQNQQHTHTATAVASGEGYANGETSNSSLFVLKYQTPYQKLGTAPSVAGISSEGGSESSPRNFALLACIKY
ncbi:MAG: hypothetical protein K0R78_3502 [Pelosinus sp.]|nr:hypothetical protein [Pelosinus sp.]